jgi:hypothetical protein
MRTMLSVARSKQINVRFGSGSHWTRLPAQFAVARDPRNEYGAADRSARKAARNNPRATMKSSRCSSNPHKLSCHACEDEAFEKFIRTSQTLNSKGVGVVQTLRRNGIIVGDPALFLPSRSAMRVSSMGFNCASCPPPHLRNKE